MLLPYVEDSSKLRRSVSPSTTKRLSVNDDDEEIHIITEPSPSPEEPADSAKHNGKRPKHGGKTNTNRHTTTAKKGVDYQEIKEQTDVPGPVPDTGYTPTKAVTLGAHNSQTMYSRASTTSFHTFTPLPPLLTKETETSVLHPNLVYSTNTLMSSGIIRPSAATSSVHTGNSPHPPRAMIVGFSVGGALVLIGIFVSIKLITRPRRRKTPTPSLPILQDGIFSDKPDQESSPVFGGKEWTSPTNENESGRGNTGLWTWTQYHSGIPKGAAALASSGSNISVKPASGKAVKQPAQVKHQYPFSVPGVSCTQNQAPQPTQNAITRAVSRLSTISMSLYPGSPVTYNEGANVGVAIDGTSTPGTGGQTLTNQKRIVPSGSRKKVLSQESFDDNVRTPRRQSFAYGGMDIISPVYPTEVAPTNPTSNGRARIKSTYYTPGTYTRSSTVLPLVSNFTRDRDLQHGVNDTPKFDFHHQRDTHALTSALGLASPALSLQPTLYPDDSLSVIGESKRVSIRANRYQKKPVPKSMDQSDKLAVSSSESANLGNLMLVDFSASKSTASLVNLCPAEVTRDGASNSTSGGRKKPILKKVEDKPPRVPSPPPLPSLAQMALAHNNPDAYNDYHSPTYSIYGLYDDDRKSCATSYG